MHFYSLIPNPHPLNDRDPRPAVVHAEELGIGDDGVFTAAFDKMDSCPYLGRHAAFGKLPFLKIFFGFGNAHPVNGLFLRGVEVEADFRYIGKDEELIGPDL